MVTYIYNIFSYVINQLWYYAMFSGEALKQRIQYVQLQLCLWPLRDLGITMTLANLFRSNNVRIISMMSNVWVLSISAFSSFRLSIIQCSICTSITTSTQTYEQAQAILFLSER